MLIDDYEIDLFCPPCDPGSEAWVATVKTDADLGELMPYVNAVVEKGDYVPGVPTLVYREGAHKYFLKSHEMGINNPARVLALTRSDLLDWLNLPCTRA